MHFRLIITFGSQFKPSILFYFILKTEKGRLQQVREFEIILIATQLVLQLVEQEEIKCRVPYKKI